MGSCAYDATLRHEIEEHIVNPTRVMYSFRDPLIQALNAVQLPTQATPRWLRADQVESAEADYIQEVGRVVQDYRKQVYAALRRAQSESDSPERYRLVYRLCPVEEWNR